MIDTTDVPVERACSRLGVSRQAFYSWKQKAPVTDNDGNLLKEIRDITLEYSKYGYRRVTHELHRRHYVVNHKRVRRIMKENNLLVRRRKFKPITTKSDHNLPVYPNMAKGMIVARLNQLWVADITYISLEREFIYLAAILDIFSRKCIGWDLGRNIDALLALNALNMAIDARKEIGFSDLVHHSDRGVQYASNAYVMRLNELGIKVSMSDKGNAYDNAYAESFMKTFKVEEVYINEYDTFADAYANIKQFIEQVYNQKRLHSSIGYVPPEEFEQKVLNEKLP